MTTSYAIIVLQLDIQVFKRTLQLLVTVILLSSRE